MKSARGASLRPSRHFGGLLFMLAAIWYAGASQGNGAAYLLCFILLGVVLASIPMTCANITGLKISPGAIKPVFAGQDAALAVELVNTSRRPRYGIRASLPGAVAAGEKVDEIPAGKGAWSTVRFTTDQRGEHTLSSLTVESQYPLGFLRARRRVPVTQSYLVYPKPTGDAHLPTPALVRGRQSERMPSEGDDFAGVRPYLPGESQRHIDWKAVARGQPVMTKQFASESDGSLHFDFHHLPMKNTEARLSQLALWIIEAERAGRHYSLRLPSQSIPESLGEAHAQKCLRALALFP